MAAGINCGYNNMAPLQNPSGFWEPKTSTLDWCENNYEVKYKQFFKTLNFKLISQQSSNLQYYIPFFSSPIILLNFGTPLLTWP